MIYGIGTDIVRKSRPRSAQLKLAGIATDQSAEQAAAQDQPQH